MPLAHQAPLMRGREFLGRADMFWLRILGRAEAGSLERVTASVAPLFHAEVMELEGADPETPLELVAVDGSRGMTEQRSEARQPLWVLMAVVGSILLIACTNLGNLLLARSSVRGREIAIRLSLGAGRVRLVRQLLTESLVLALLGGVAGLMLAKVSLAALGNALAASGLPVSLDLDATVLTFTLVTSVLTGLAFGIAPALRASSVDLTPALKQGPDRQAPGRAGRRPLSKALLVVQVAISLLVLLTAGLFVRTLQNLYATDGGYQVQGVLLFNLDPALNGYDPEARVRLFDEVAESLGSLPGVSAAAASELVPLGGMMSSRTVHVPDSTATHERERTSVVVNVVSNSFFDTFSIPMRAGRGFGVADGPGAGRVAIVNEAFVREYYPDTNPVGRRLGWAEDAIDVEIVGVVGDVAYQNLRDGVRPSVHVPYAQAPGGATQMTLAMRVNGDPLSLTAAAREQVRQIDADLPLYDVRTQRAQRDSSLASERIFASLSSMLGLVALGLASIGLYGMLSYSVARRTREIGVRIALGARQGDIGSLVARELLPVGLGIMLGVVLAWGVTRWLDSMLYDLQPMDPLALTAAIGLLAAVAALAAALPAWRASHVDPVKALRFE
jgi:predicted permease